MEAKIEESAKKGVQLLVTPEYGLTGFPGQERSRWWDYAIDIPDLIVGESVYPNPCLEASQFPGAVTRLSCAARAHGLAVIVGLIDMKQCSFQSFPSCGSRDDGWLLFNTALAFDADGAYIAKYHKANLWGEDAVDPGHDCKLPEFYSRKLNTTFGMFICADVVNAWPVLELVGRGIQHFVMPLSWSNEMFQMQPLSWIQAWSKLMNVTVAAANTRSRGSTSGSGIFYAGIPLAVAYNLSTEAPDELAVADVPEFSPPLHLPAVCPTSATYPPAIKPHWSQWLTYQLNMSVGSHHLAVCSNYQPGFAHGATCCNVTYTSKREGRGYVMALLNGLDFAPGIAPWAGEACAILPCPDDSTTDCLSYPTEALLDHRANWFGEFSVVELTVAFSVSQLVFPQVLAGPDRLLLPAAWHLESAKGTGTVHSLMLSGEDAADLVSLQLYGRPYMKDPNSSHKCPCVPSSIWF